MMVTTTEVDLHLCYPSPKAREVDASAVNKLAESIAETGLLQPITVRKVRKSRAGQVCDAFEVIAGMHRVKAFRRLGRETIPAVVTEMDDLRAELALIDENLCRNDLSPAERSAAQARRKAIYQQIHPETKNHAAGNGRTKKELVGQVGQATPAPRFDEAAAAATGQSERAVRRDVTRGEALGEDTLAKVARTSLDKGEELDALAKLAPEVRTELIDRASKGEKVSAKIEAKKQIRTNKEVLLAEKAQALPTTRYCVIYADPPWRFEPYSRDTGMDRAPENHYPTMTLQQILDLPVPSVMADDCVLFLWATVPMLPEAFRVMAAWGFTYKSHCIWNKNKIGTGYWFRNKHELLLVGVKGSIPAPLPGTQSASVIDAPLKDHSRKPIIFRGMIEGLFPNLPKLELFARTPAPGWGQWGKEAPEIAIDDNEASVDHVTAEDRLMDAHRADDNDGVRNAPEGGFEIEAERGAVTSVSLPEDDSVQPTAANVTPVGEAASTGSATVSASCAGSAGSPAEDDDVLDIRKFAGWKFFRGAA